MREIHILGPKTKVLAIRSNLQDVRDFLAASPVALGLRDLHIAHCGIMQAVHPFEIVRPDLSGTFFLACFAGHGRVLVDGNWLRVSAGQACVQPPFIPNAIQAERGSEWQFCWVRYQEPTGMKRLISLHAPAIGSFASEPLRCAIQGLHTATANSNPDHLQRKWIDLIQSYVSVFAQPFHGDKRLVNLWDKVERSLHEDWTLERLAEFAEMSKEHLRRVCMKSVGRAPAQHLAFLRMNQAAHLLTSSDDSIGEISARVGYANQFAFSDAFKNWLGCRPSEYRRSNPANG